jgi:hypothetical protein
MSGDVVLCEHFNPQGDCEHCKAEGEESRRQICAGEKPCPICGTVVQELRKLLENNKEGFCKMSAENIQLMEENEALRRLLPLREK